MRILRYAVPVLLAACAGACAHDYRVESRDTPVHVWLTAPDLKEQAHTVDVLIYVGAEKVVQGPVRFPPGVGHVVLPTVYVTAGNQNVSAVVRGGTTSGTTVVGVTGETWVQITVRGRAVTIVGYDGQPVVPQ